MNPVLLCLVGTVFAVPALSALNRASDCYVANNYLYCKLNSDSKLEYRPPVAPRQEREDEFMIKDSPSTNFQPVLGVLFYIDKDGVIYINKNKAHDHVKKPVQELAGAALPPAVVASMLG